MREGALCSGIKNTCNDDLCCIKLKSPESSNPKSDDPGSDDSEIIKFMKDNYIWFIIGAIVIILLIIAGIVLSKKQNNITEPEYIGPIPRPIPN